MDSLELLTITKVAKVLKVGHRVASELMNTHKIRSWYVGKRLMTNTNEIQRYHEHNAEIIIEKPSINHIHNREQRVQPMEKTDFKKRIDLIFKRN